MSVTVRDIARATGVSIGTVSRALKQQPGLTEATRQLILEAAEQLGYDFSKLKTGKLRRVCFLLHRQHNTLASSPFFSPVLHGAESACREMDIVLSFLSLGPADPVLSQLKRHDPDAIVCAGFFEPEVLALIKSLGKPVALIDAMATGLHTVNPDNMRGAYLATQHLIQQGRQRIAYLSGSQAHYSIRERAHGYRKALFDARQLSDPDLEVTLNPDMPLEEAAREATLQLLSLPQRPDAIFGFNDSVALAAMRVCLAEGLRVPADIAIVGFDDIDAAQQSIPSLTTIHVNKEALGREGIQLLQLHEQDTMEQRIQPVELVIRQSSASA
nr:LacI family DNA-binding transcriptional regulator [Leeia oryzae]